MNEYRFLPWARGGLGAGIAPDASGPRGRSTAKVTISVAHGRGPADIAKDVHLVTKDVQLFGPGDVVGLDPRQVIRTDPAPGATEFEQNYFPLIEFDAPELPWLFSPLVPAASARQRPWLCLIVVRQDRASVESDPRTPLPVLRVEAATQELPDLGESWAWAHAQVTGAEGDVAQVLRDSPERTLSRLVCPRRLETGKSYLACLVPSFKAGVQAGLGATVDAVAEPAWVTPAPSTVTLPVDHQWRFTTGGVGEFASLARRLEPRELDAAVSTRPMDLSNPRGGLPPSATLGLEGALRSPLFTRDRLGTDTGFERELEKLLNGQPGQAKTVVLPPAYGEHHTPRPPANQKFLTV
ncbi:MAG: hypothetical protein H0T96_07375 [Thermoleophilaceae bacterium]|nr:hypothetical protein [Thermoleophilaceae bacterium]